MALVLSDEQQLLKDTAKDLFATRCPVSALRKLRDDKHPDGLSRELWKEMTGLGWAGMLLPEEYGGVDFGVVGLGIVMEQAGRSLAATPLLATVALASRIILNAGTEAQKRAVLPKIADGSILATLAVDEGAQHTRTIAMEAINEGDAFTLNGTKTMVMDGHIADLFIVAANIAGAASRSPTLFLVEKGHAGVEVERLTTVDSRNLANVRFSSVKLTGENLLGAQENAWAAIDDALDVGRSALAAEMLGGTQEAFERTINYLKMREQFGQPLGSFQALQHRASMLFGEIELSKSVVVAALSGFDERANDVAALASLAKAKAGGTYQAVSREAVQMHGGIGMTDEEEIGFFLKRARVCEQLLGNQRFHRDRYAKLHGF